MTARAMHPRNRYAGKAPDFAALAAAYPSFAQYVRFNHNGRASIDWTDYNATRELTRILLEGDYGVKWWIPDGQLCPTVTNRANYIHWIEDLLQEFPSPRKKDTVTGVDIGTGANCIYPLLGASLLGWRFVGTDVAEVALEWARKNVSDNPQLEELIEVRSAHDEGNILVNVLKEDEDFDFCMCNPPFFESIEEAGQNPRTACGGTMQEMVCPGGEAAFVSRIIADSIQLNTRIHWYTSMVGKKSSLKVLTAELWKSGVTMLKTTEFVQGRTSRWGLAWTFTNRLKASVSRVVSGRNNSFSFTLEGIPRQCSALDVVNALRSHLEDSGASCRVEASSFTINGTLSATDSVVGKRTRDDVLIQKPETALSDTFDFTATVYQQSPGCLLIKASTSKAEGTARLSSVLERAESLLSEQFPSRVRQKL